VVLDVLPKTFNRANTCVSGLLGTLFGVATPRKLLKNFRNFVVIMNRCIAIPFAFYE
jgi:purine-cytosine permease-like protein